MKKTTIHSPEVRERAVRMVPEHLNDYPSEWAAIEAIAPKIGCVAQTLHGWIRRHQTDAGQRPGQTSEERKRIKDLKRAASCVKPLRSCVWPARILPRWSSTAPPSAEGICRSAP